MNVCENFTSFFCLCACACVRVRVDEQSLFITQNLATLASIQSNYSYLFSRSKYLPVSLLPIIKEVTVTTTPLARCTRHALP